jgi:hypothetical protein
MAFDKTEKARRDADIYEAYKKLESKKTPKGKSLYSRAVIVEFLNEKFYISEYTIDLIITQQYELEREKQLGVKQYKLDMPEND